MKHEVHVDAQAELALVRFNGRVDLPSLFSVLRALPEKGFGPGYCILWDAQSVQEAVLRPGDLQRLMRHYARQVGSGDGHAQEAAVVQRPLDHSVAELYRELAERRGYEVAVCWKSEEALDYLGLEELPEALQR